MDRDEFEKLVSCANEDGACAAAFFQTQNPYNITQEFAPLLKDEFTAKSEQIKLLFDMFCANGKFAMFTL